MMQNQGPAVRLKNGWRSAGDMDPRLVILSRGPRLYSTRRLAEEAEESATETLDKAVEYAK